MTHPNLTTIIHKSLKYNICKNNAHKDERVIIEETK